MGFLDEKLVGVEPEISAHLGVTLSYILSLFFMSFINKPAVLQKVIGLKYHS